MNNKKEININTDKNSNHNLGSLLIKSSKASISKTELLCILNILIKKPLL